MTGPTTLFRVARAHEHMVRMIVGRCHVGEDDGKVVAYAVSRLKRPRLPWEVEVVSRLARVIHRQNRRLYADVMAGSL